MENIHFRWFHVWFYTNYDHFVVLIVGGNCKKQYFCPLIFLKSYKSY